MWCSTASTTTMASSTTMPMASTSPKSVRLFRLKPGGRHHGEGADDGHGHGHQRDDGRPPVLQEQQHHQGHQEHGVAEGLEDLADRLADERRGVVDDGVVHAGGKPLLQLLHLLPAPAWPWPGRWSRAIGRRRGPPRAGRPWCRSGRSSGAQLDAAHVADADDPPVGVGPQDHVGELLGVGQAAQRGHRVLEGLAAGHRRLADLAGRHLHVLLLDRRHHVVGREVPGRHFLRVQPEPHAVVALAQVADVAHAVQPRQLVAQLDRGVVAQRPGRPGCRRARTG